MGTVRFQPKRTTGKRTAIRAIVHHEGKRQVFKTGISIKPEHWDKKRERVKIPGQPELESRINSQLAAFRATVAAIGTLAPEQAVRTIKTIQEAIERHKSRMKAAGRSIHSIKSFTTLTGKLADFRPGEIKIKAVNKKFIEDLTTWMNARNYTNSHTRKMVRLLQTILRIENPDGAWKGVKVPPEKNRDEIYLTTAEIEAIRAVPVRDSLQRAKDLFLAGCYTGLRFSDLGQVQQSRLQKIGDLVLLRVSVQKTKQTLTVPVSPALAEIIDRYPEGIPMISNQKLNRHLKELAEVAGLTQTVEVTEYRAGQTIRLQFRKCDLVYTHTARRSFATNGVLAGIPIPEMMKFTGHKSLTSFIRYIRTSNEDAALLYSSHAFFNSM